MVIKHRLPKTSETGGQLIDFINFSLSVLDKICASRGAKHTNGWF